MQHILDYKSFLEDIEYFIDDKDDKDPKKVSKDEFINFGMSNKFEPKRDSDKGFKMNITDRKVIGFHESHQK